MIIGKTNIDQENYDCLVFCVRDDIPIKIPNFIEHICPYAFDGCTKLQQVDISDESKLRIIDNNAFSRSSIKSIKITSQVTRIGENAFSSCLNLKFIEFANDSKLQIIESSSFKGS